MRVIILCLAVFTSGCLAKSYEGYQIVKVVPNSYAGSERLQMMLQIPDITLLKTHSGRHGDRSFDVMIPPNSFDSFRRILRPLNTDVSILIDDLQSLMDKQNMENEIAKKISKPSARIDNTFYRTLDEIYAELDNFAATYPSLMSVSTIGTTYEGRDIRLMKISAGGSDTRQIVWIDCGIHAREWITPASCLYFIDSLSTYGSDSEITSLVDTYDFYILTVANPDGYDYTWTADRLWRKNRVPWTTCYGTDLNRNFDSNFGGVGSSDVACSDTYHGPSAFSEFETQAIRDAIVAFDGRVKLFFTLHSYSQLWMTPWGYTTDLPPDYDEMYRVAGIGVTALEAVYGTQYQYGSIANIIYEASGGSTDWTYDTIGILYSYALELRDQGQFGFLLPAVEIEPTATETWEGLKAAITAAQ